MAILKIRRPAYPTVATLKQGRADLSHCDHFRKREAAYPTVATLKQGRADLSHCDHFRKREAAYPTVAILKNRRAAYPTLATLKWGRADLSHCEVVNMLKREDLTYPTVVISKREELPVPFWPH